MAGIKYDASTVSHEEIASRAGGERLRLTNENPWPVEVLFEQGNAEMGRGGGAAKIKQYFNGTKERREASEALLDALESSNLLVPLLLSVSTRLRVSASACRVPVFLVLLWLLRCAGARRRASGSAQVCG
eukprot:2409731-Rhodomonas_salina.1